VVTHTEPFHVSTAIATLDYASEGRAGVRLRVSRGEEKHFGRREFPSVTPGTPEAERLTAELFDEASDYAEVLRRLWDSWEDDAVIRDVPTGRFIDRDKLHYIDFEGEWFSVRGPSITPRPPQGQPVIAVLAHADIPFRLAARAADLAFITPHDRAETAEITSKIKATRPIRSLAIGRAPGGSGGSSPRKDTFSAERIIAPAKAYADLTLFVDDEPGAAAARRARLDEAAGAEYRSDSAIVAGTPAEIADLLLEWQSWGLDGFRLRPGALPRDLEGITRGLVPELQRRGAFRTSYAESTLRERLGLDPHPANRYAANRTAANRDVPEVSS
jgi:alkanesulfonate monooxygenase SsuD/methylene tetrahydromethanopterin reductase-like flavin-dependent oxidoreductase (luciferase family)